MDGELLMINGIDGSTGGYLTPPLPAHDVSKLAQGELLDSAHLAELQARHRRDTEQTFGPIEGVDPMDLSSAGWGVVFAHNADPAVKDALKELLEHRKGQATKKRSHYYKEYTADKAYRSGDPEENKRKFLARNGAAVGMPADPDKVPYYLLLVGSPDAIPYRFQYQLDVEYAVGRLWFEKDGKPDLEAFARYARSVVEAESGKLSLARRAAFVGVQNDDDAATQLSAVNLVEPLAQGLQQSHADWSFETFLKDKARKTDFARLLGGPDTPSLLFTASHGMGFPNGDTRQLPHQGALLCQDWPGPRNWRQSIPHDYYIAAEDVGDDSRLLGLLAFHFACYGAGTPNLDDFAHLKQLTERATIAPHPFIARLPQRLLSHPKGGALAMVGHIERAWGCSFYGGNRLGRQLQAFQSTLSRLLEGCPVGWALEYFNQLYAALSSDLSEELENIKFGKIPDDFALAEMWTANNDARCYVVLGDPAVRVPTATPGSPPRERPEIGAVSLPTGGSGAKDGPSTVPATPAGPTSWGLSTAPTSPAGDVGASFAVPISETEKRYSARQPVRERVSFAAGLPRLLERNDPERVRRRLRRLGMAPEAIQAFLSGTPSFAAIADPNERESAELLLERIIGTNDLVEARFLEAGARASRTVGRIRIRTASGRSAGFGTGSLIGPRLLLTNHHVLADAAQAAASVVELNVQEGLDRRPLTPEVFSLAPNEFFMTDPAIDFSLVAVMSRSTAGTDLETFGWNRQLEEDDPVLVEEYVNIIQHPGGQPKQVALRDNQVIDLLPDFLHYRADTEPGSSGAPVFNDQWELIGLHHSGVPKRDAQGRILARGGEVWAEEMGERAIDWIANEGVRLSRVLTSVKGQVMSGDTQRRMRDGLFSASPPPATGPSPTAPSVVSTSPQEGTGAAAVNLSAGPPEAAGGVTVTVPLQVSIRLGTPSLTAAPTALAPAPKTPTPAIAPPDFAEAVSIDPEYGNREGYDPEFLGGGLLRVPLPRLSPDLQAAAAVVQGEGADGKTLELKYHHYSVVLNRKRRLAFFTAVNIDGRLARNPKREQDKWFYDPRVGRDEQVGNDLYKGTTFDRGHLVRRLDPAWGRTERIAKVANDDTFHFTNCSPQHERFNEGKNLWAGLEDYLLGRVVDDRKRLIIFTGPVFAADDPEFRGVKIPRQFWKVAVIPRPNGQLAALGFLVSQAELIRPVVEEAALDVARTFQVPVSKVAEVTGLDFGPLSKLDTGTVDRFGRERADVRELDTLADIELPGAEEAEPGAGGPVNFAAPSAVTRPPEGVPGTDLGYYLLAYDESNQERRDIPAGLVSGLILDALKRDPVTDVFLFSHGWMGDVPAARDQYRGWIKAMADNRADIDRIRNARLGFRPLLIGLHWPSLPWGDEQFGPVSFAPDADPITAMVDAYARRLRDTPEVREHLRTVISAASVPGEPPELPADVAEAYRALDRLVGLPSQGVGAAPGQDREAFDPEAIYQEARVMETPAESVSFGISTWDSLLAPLRTLSFWTMKDRARTFGEGAVHPLLVRLQQESADREARFHLMGHSFGCIVASAAVAGPSGASSLPRPVDSLALVQGAFSLWSYCADIPYARGTPGYFHRIVSAGKVRGPIITTQSRFDRAVGTWYPLGAQIARQVSFAPGELPKYGAVGSFGLQGAGLSISDEPMRPTNSAYSFASSKVYNLEASQYIRAGGGFEGAHGDIRHPEVAHAVWQAAGRR